MAISDLYGSGSQLQNFTHFSALVYLAAINGEITPEKEEVLKRLAHKLDIDEEQYKQAVSNPSEFPVDPPYTNMDRLERLYEVITLIFADNKMEEREAFLVEKYAVALGFSAKDSREVIDASVRILSGKISFESYLYLLRKMQSEE